MWCHLGENHCNIPLTHYISCPYKQKFTSCYYFLKTCYWYKKCIAKELIYTNNFPLNKLNVTRVVIKKEIFNYLVLHRYDKTILIELMYIVFVPFDWTWALSPVCLFFCVPELLIYVLVWTAGNYNSVRLNNRRYTYILMGKRNEGSIF